MNHRELGRKRIWEGCGQVVSAVALLMVYLAATPSVEGKSKPQVLIVGGGTSHDFVRAYRQIDAQTLTRAGFSVRYIEGWTQVLSGLKGTRILMQASNQLPPPDPATQKAIMDFVENGGSLLIVHAGLWYNWPTWTEYNRTLVGGGSRSHDKLGNFEVTITHPEHRMMQGLPAKFSIQDELYHEESDPAGSPVEVLATATSPTTGKTFPSIWVVHPNHGTIACISLGHDDVSHNNPAYSRLLANTVRWLAEKSASAPIDSSK